MPNSAIAAIIGPRTESLRWKSRRPNYPSAWHGHVAFIHWLIDAIRPNMIVELGTENGVSYAAMCHAVAALGLPAKTYAIDTWQGDDHTVAYGETVFDDLNAFNQKHYSHFSTLLRCTFDEALPRFARRSVDLLHIDGLHTYAAVKHDFETWLPTVSDRGVILFHDTAIREADFGVWQLWAELKPRFPSFTFEHSAGLGVLLVGPSQPQAVVALCKETDTHAIDDLRSIFADASELARGNVGERDRLPADDALLALSKRVETMEQELQSLAAAVRAALLPTGRG